MEIEQDSIIDTQTNTLYECCSSDMEALCELLNKQDTKWQKLKEWIEKDHDWNLERGNNDCALGQRWVLDKMQELEGEKDEKDC